MTANSDSIDPGNGRNGNKDYIDPGNEKKDDNGPGNETEDEDLPITFALPRCIVKILEGKQDDGEETSVDHEYFNSLLAVETCRALIYYLGEHNRHEYFKVKTDSLLNRRKAVGESLNDIFAELSVNLETTRKRLEDRDQTPLLEKFLDVLDANPEEKNVFRFLLCVSMMPPQFFDKWQANVRARTVGTGNKVILELATAANISAMFDIPLPAVMKLMNPDSIWVKEGLYYSNALARPARETHLAGEGLPSSSFVIQGFSISMNQYNELKSTLLQKALMEHPPFRDSDLGKRIAKLNGTSGEALPDNLVKQPNVLANALNSGAETKVKRKDRLFHALTNLAQAEMKQTMLDKRNNKVSEEKLMDALPLGTVGSFEQPTPPNEASRSTEELPTGEESGKESKSNEDELTSYASDLAYLEDQCRANTLKKSIVQLKCELNMDEDNLEDAKIMAESNRMYIDGIPFPQGRHGQKMDENAIFQKQKKLEKLEKRMAQLQVKISSRIQVSASQDGKLFRLEQLCEALDLGAFEKSCILLLLQDTIIPPLKKGVGTCGVGYRGPLSVGTMISSFCITLEEKMHSRSFFYKTSTFVEEGILTLVNNDDFTLDLNDCSVTLDRRLFDFLIGLDTEMSELVDGSHLYKPDISVDDVILPEQNKKRVLDAVLNFDKVKDVINETGMGEKISYGLNQVLLFYGASGTGKTMFANAIATKLGVKMLLVNFPNFGNNSSGAIIKFFFREARINKALLFFDECESLFMSRDKQGGRGSVNMMLTELERWDGICILATNRAFDLDEAMHRRISLSIEFQKPDHIMRERLWKAIKPPGLPLDENINFNLLGRKYELVGGTVKNAWIQSVSLMIERGAETVSQEDLEQAASEQVRNQLTSEDFDRRVVPTVGIDEMVLDEAVKESLSSIVQYSKAQSVLFGQWGFDKIHRSTSGISVLFHGVPGTGKTMAAEAIGFDLGKPLLVVNVAELVSKWVGETGKNIDKIFATAKSKDAVLVFDEAEGLFGSRQSSNGGSTSRHDTMNVGLLLQYIENFAGICVVITNMKSSIDDAFFRRFRFVLEFKMPSVEERERIWKATLPEQCPIAKDVDFAQLARTYTMSGGGVRNALLRAATMAALRDGGENVVTMQDLKAACEAEEGKTGNRSASMGMYS